MSLPPPRVAIACSGLGHIQRGIESWAADTAQALREAGLEVRLFGGGPRPDLEAVANCRREGAAARRVSGLLRHLGGWRYRLGSPYDVEQASFSLGLWPRIRRGVDILHVQDPTIALWFAALRRAGLSGARVVYANGTGEPPAVMRRFRHLQLLTPSARADWAGQEPPGQQVFTIPNFIDTDAFTPGTPEERAAARAALGLPAQARIVLCCAAIRRHHKRIDVMLEEFARFAATAGDEWLLLVAGGREPDTEEIMRAGEALLGPRVRFMPSVPRADMLRLYRAADVLALASLFEMFGIVLLEGMAAGLPVLCHDAPSFRGIVGPAGHFADLSVPGGIAGGLRALAEPAYRARLGAAARPHVAAHFSKQVVVAEMIAMYRAVMDG